MPVHRDLIVVGASAGGVEALSRLVAKLPGDLPATVLVVLHIPPASSSSLARILDRSGSLPATAAHDGAPLVPGRILVAPPDHHLLVAEGRVRLARGPRENGHRPAVDPLFRSAARWYGPRVIGVVLSGNLDDGSAGLLTIRGRGGATVVQDPEDAYYASMPRNAIAVARPDHVTPIDDVGALLERLVLEPVASDASPLAEISEDLVTETGIAALDLDALHPDNRPGRPAGLSCPDCTGALWEIEEQGLHRYRCRVGHAWSPSSLLAQQDHELEGALWAALRSLEDRAALARRMATSGRIQGRQLSAVRFETQAAEDEGRATLIRDLLVSWDGRDTSYAPEQ